MGSKLGLILSLGIIFIALLFGADLFMIQINYTDLDAMSTYVSYKISKEREVSEYLKGTLEEKNIYIIEDNPPESGQYAEGESCTYSLKRSYSPLVMGNKAFEITVTRTVIVAIYN